MSATGQRRIMPLAHALDELTSLHQDGHLAAADDLAAKMRKAMPEHPHILHISGLIAYQNGRTSEALEHMEASARLAPKIALYHSNICEIYRSSGKIEEALRSAQCAVELAPKDPRAWFNLALIHYERLELDAAIKTADRAIELDPDFPEAHFQKAEALLLSGRMAEGWDYYEWRFRLEQAEGMLPKTDKPQWDGQALSPKKLLIIGDQGFGDCIQFGRYISWAASRCPEPTFACSNELRVLFQTFPGIGKIVSRWEDTGDYDAYIPLSGLPRLMKTEIKNVSKETYLSPSPESVRLWGSKLQRLLPPGKRRIAIVWAGQPTHKNDRKRSLTLRHFEPLFMREDLAIVTVQKGDQIAQVGSYYGHSPLLNLGPEIVDFCDTMAILKNVERLVTIDTSVAHVAGASGIPTFLLLPYAPDWRWLLGRDDTIWYESVRLFRQSSPYDWAGVLERVAASL